MSRADGYHRPVMADEAVGYLITRRDGTFVDATAGGGSHTALIVSRLLPSGTVLAIDRDDDAVAATQHRTEEFGSQVTVLRGEFSRLKELALEAGIASVDGTLFDLGVSSFQLDTAGRGFSYRADGPLDCRMDRRQPTTAADIVNSASRDKLADIFYTYGGEKNSRRLAAAVVEARRSKPLTTTAQLTEIVASVTNPRYINKTLSRVFQSLRLVVNDEVGQLEQGLAAAVDLLSVGGRLVVITYHSLEDRIVKIFMRDHARSRASRPGGIDDIPADLRLLTKKPETPSLAEIAENTRARSAKLRVAEKC